MNGHTLDSSQSDNEITLQSYQDKTEQYVQASAPVDDELKAWIDASLTLIPESGKILEIGSGCGWDAEYITARGFAVECTDAVPNFIKILKKKGFDARTLNVLTDPIEGTYDMVFADAVLLHYTPQEAAQVTKKIHAALNDAGIFALRVKKGDGAAWTNAKLDAPRYFHYWQPKKLEEMLADCGFKRLYMAENHTSHNNADWIGVIARRIA